MPRARNIKPQIMANEDLAELDPLARLLFIYLWMLADREGRLEDRHKRIRGQAFPYENIDADKLLWDLHKSGFILRYAVEDTAIIQILKFSEHQAPHLRETESKLPPPEQSTTKAVPRHDLGSAEASPRSPDSLFPYPSSLNPSSLKEDSLQNPSSAAPTEPEEKREPLAEGFEEFWDAYPKKVDKKNALSAWKAKKLNGHAQEVIDHVRLRRIQDKAWIDGFVMSPKIFLRDERWKDEYTQAITHREKVLRSLEQRTNPIIEGRLTDG